MSNNNAPSVEELYAMLLASNTGSLLKKHLTTGVFEKLKDKLTDRGGTLADCIRSGCLHPKSTCGVYATDPGAYDVFSGLFHPIILDYHKTTELGHPDPDFGDVDDLDFSDLDPENKFIISTRIRVARNHNTFGFPPTLSKEDRLEIERRTVDALQTLPEDLAGKYYPLQELTQAVQKQWTKDHFLFRDDSRFRVEVGGYDYWPTARGIFFSNDKRFIVWVNEGDHLRLISMQAGGNVAEVWKRLVKGVKTLETKLAFAHHPKFGYLTFCPTNLGTTVRASVHIRIPKLSQQNDFIQILENLHLQARGVHGEHSDSESGVYDISNQRRLRISEVEAVQEMTKGVLRIIELEKKLSTK